ncbi:MAG: hypothetical protein AB1351_10280 [Thermoproteota archaeon]
MKNFYAGILGMPVVQKEGGKLFFLKAGKSMLWIFNSGRTRAENDKLPAHGAAPHQAHTLQGKSKKQTANGGKELLAKNNIALEKEAS